MSSSLTSRPSDASWLKPLQRRVKLPEKATLLALQDNKTVRNAHHRKRRMGRTADRATFFLWPGDRPRYNGIRLRPWEPRWQAFHHLRGGVFSERHPPPLPCSEPHLGGRP